jgi:hypothetical protein
MKNNRLGILGVILYVFITAFATVVVSISAIPQFLLPYFFGVGFMLEY